VAAGKFAHDPEAVDLQRRSDENLDHDSPISELFEDQLVCADLVVANKADLLDDDAAERLEAELNTRIRRGVRWLRTTHGAVDPGVVLGVGAGAELNPGARSEIHHPHPDSTDDGEAEPHDHEEFESFVIVLPEVSDATRFADGLPGVLERFGILRLKGFAAVRNKPMRLIVQAVGHRVDHYFDRPLGGEESRSTRLVIIGEAGLDRSGIEAAVGAMVH